MINSLGPQHCSLLGAGFRLNISTSVRGKGTYFPCCCKPWHQLFYSCKHLQVWIEQIPMSWYSHTFYHFHWKMCLSSTPKALFEKRRLTLHYWYSKSQSHHLYKKVKIWFIAAWHRGKQRIRNRSWVQSAFVFTLDFSLADLWHHGNQCRLWFKT